MSKITGFTRQNLQALRTEMNAALKQVADKHGIEFEVGNMSYSELIVNTKVTIKASTADGETELTKDYKEYHERFGLKLEWLNQTFVHRSKVYRITGLNMRSRKYPVVAESAFSPNVNGTEYRFIAAEIIRIMSKLK